MIFYVRRYLSLGLIWLLLVAAKDPIRIETLRVYPSPTGSRVVLQSNRPVSLVTYSLENPDRLILDPVEEDLQDSISTIRRLKASGVVTSWEVIRRGKIVDYIVFSVVLPVKATVYQAGGTVTLDLKPDLGELVVPAAKKKVVSPKPLPKKIVAPAPKLPQKKLKKPKPIAPKVVKKPVLVKAAPPKPPPRKPAPPAPKPPPAPEDELPDLSAPLSATEAINKALAVYEEVRVAIEEVELSVLKVKEARRNLFPTASVRGTVTRGTASGVNFDEIQSGLQVEHPLYDSGSLKDAYHQALVNLQVSQKRYEKVRADYAFDVAKAYYELMAAYQGQEARGRLNEEAQRVLKMTERRYEAELLTRMELLQVRSQASQALFQLRGAQSEVEVAELKFRNKMNWPDSFPIHFPKEFPEKSPLVTLQEAVQIAKSARPDVQINTLLVEFNRLEEQIAKKKGRWKVELTGFAGVSGSAFETETLDLGQDFSVSLKLSKPWGGNTGSVTATKVDTSERLGQTTRTDSESIQAEVGILDALAGKTEAQEAYVGRLKAEKDLMETQMLLKEEVQEAYFAYKKSDLTLDYAQERERYRREQVKILRAQAELNEVLLSQLMEAQLQLSDDEVSQWKARADFSIALARLDKAIGKQTYY